MPADRPTDALSAETAASRSGVSTAEIQRLTELGILPATDGRYTEADVRRVLVVQTLERAGLPLDALADVLRGGGLSLDFIDEAGRGVFSALSETTFSQLAEETGIPVAQLTALRDVTGGKAAGPDDRVREDELAIVPLVAYQLELGFSWSAVERALRVYGDSLRRIAESEAEWWRSEVQQPMLAAGMTADAVGRRAGEISPRLSVHSDRALMAIYHAQQQQVWSTNIVDGIAAGLEQAGLHRREERPPAICFLDISGYTALTHERGDQAAAELAGTLARVVQRVAVEHGGRPIKWLGDGVMLHLPDPTAAIPAAVAMVDAIAAAGMPLAHIGLHAGPIVIQEGDYYGRTVNLASRIGEYARPGEILVSADLVEAAGESPISLASIGMVELKGVPGTIELYAVQPAG
jgi:adenylate cyclase